MRVYGRIPIQVVHEMVEREPACMYCVGFCIYSSDLTSRSTDRILQSFVPEHVTSGGFRICERVVVTSGAPGKKIV